VKSELENIRQSIGRVAAFGRAALGEITSRKPANSALDLIADEANAWAAKQAAHDLPNGFHITQWKPTDYDEWTKVERKDYNGWSVVREFFERASLIEQFVKAAAKSAAGCSDGRLELSPIEWLAGRRLPEIYERVFKDAFGAGVSRSGEAGPGIMFIIEALKLLGVRPSHGDAFSPNTIKNHVAASRKATD
jgi:hypothetical protein